MKIKWLKLFGEIIAIYSDHHMKSTNRLCGQNAELLNVKQVTQKVTGTQKRVKFL